MKTLNSLLKTTKNSMLVLSLLLLTMIGAQAQPLYTQDASGPNLCDGFASLDSINVFPPVIWTNVNTGQIISSPSEFSIWPLCPGEYAVTFNDISGNSLTVAFTIGGAGNPNPCAGFTASMTTTNTDLNNCTGTATLTISGGTAPYSISWGNSNSILSSLSNLCEGSYSATVVDANGCSTSATGFVYEDGITPPADTVIVILNNTFPPNAITDSLPTTTLIDCNLDFDSIGSASITNVLQDTVGVIVTWTVFDLNGNVMTSYDIFYANLNPSGAVYQATLIIMCGRSINMVQITDQFEFDPASSSIVENTNIDFALVNPIPDELNIQFTQLFEGQITMLDLKGAVIFSETISTTRFVKNLTNLSSGVYVLQLQSADGLTSRQIVK